MNISPKIRTIAMLLVADGLIAVLCLVFDGPQWLWVVVGLLLLLAAFLALRSSPTIANRLTGKPEHDSAPAEVPYEKRAITSIPLPSSVPDYDFHLSATVWWRPAGPATGLIGESLPGLAVDAVLTKARWVAKQEPPERFVLVQHQLTRLLGQPFMDPAGTVETGASDVTLSVSEADASRLARLSDMRKEEVIWEQERRQEKNKREYLGADVLKTPGSAVVWWLARHDEQVDSAVNLIGPLAQLSAAANNEDVTSTFLHMIPFPPPAQPEASFAAPHNGSHAAPAMTLLDHFKEVIDGLDLEESVRDQLAHRFATYIASAGRPDVADQILQDFRTVPDDLGPLPECEDENH
ncbi:hypothetical protein AB0J35_62275 [Nonomuraea angiospora]|uniref:hypothetical protein n=1 Tax=Nonomuraea angiospora TaxID=46172 RepID=UPI0034368D86